MNRPILEGALAERALARVDDFAASLPDVVAALEDPSLGEGLAGVGLFLHSIGRRADAERALDRALDLVLDGDHGPSLLAGFTGVAWVLEHTTALDEEDRCEDVVHALLGHVARVEPLPLELGFGLAGIGVYALERLPRPGARELLRATVERIVARGGHASWDPSPEGRLDAGLAHGVAGVLAFLAAARRAGEDVPAELLAEGVRWLVSLREPGAAVPPFVPPAGEPRRSGWCYGDPGVACALSLAGLEAPPHVTAETVEGASLCHGAAGVAHGLTRLGRREEARPWLAQLLDAPRAGAGLLSGEAGVGLVLHAAATGEVPCWDRCLLLSAREVSS